MFCIFLSSISCNNTLFKYHFGEFIPDYTRYVMYLWIQWAVNRRQLNVMLHIICQVLIFSFAFKTVKACLVCGFSCQVQRLGYYQLLEHSKFFVFKIRKELETSGGSGGGGVIGDQGNNVIDHNSNVLQPLSINSLMSSYISHTKHHSVMLLSWLYRQIQECISSVCVYV